MLRLVLIDFDGTLADTIDILWQCYLKFLVIEGIEGHRSEFEKLKGPSLAEIITYLKNKYNLRGSYELLFNTYHQLILETYATNAQPMPCAREVLAFAVKHNLKCCLVTVAPLSIVVPFLKKFKFDIFFNHIVTLRANEESKPKPDLYLRALHEMETHASEALAIEDSLAGIQSAKFAGIKVVAFNHETSQKDVLSAKTWENVHQIILKLLA